jgi:hypothetical protein
VASALIVKWAVAGREPGANRCATPRPRPFIRGVAPGRRMPGVVMEEESEYRRFAIHDLAVLEARRDTWPLIDRNRTLYVS